MSSPAKLSGDVNIWLTNSTMTFEAIIIIIGGDKKTVLQLFLPISGNEISKNERNALVRAAFFIILFHVYF